jgi:hypothetical protein
MYWRGSGLLAIAIGAKTVSIAVTILEEKALKQEPVGSDEIMGSVRVEVTVAARCRTKAQATFAVMQLEM